MYSNVPSTSHEIKTLPFFDSRNPVGSEIKRLAVLSLQYPPGIISRDPNPSQTLNTIPLSINQQRTSIYPQPHTKPNPPLAKNLAI